MYVFVQQLSATRRAAVHHLHRNCQAGLKRWSVGLPWLVKAQDGARHVGLQNPSCAQGIAECHFVWLLCEQRLQAHLLFVRSGHPCV